MSGAERANLPMKIHKAVLFAERGRLLVRFVISGKHPKTFTERSEHGGATIETLTKIREITGGDVDVRGLRNDFFECTNIAVNITENQNFHGDFFPELWPFDCCGRRSRNESEYQPCSMRFPVASKTT